MLVEPSEMAMLLILELSLGQVQKLEREIVHPRTLFL
jgi:hypothetical protein